MPPPPLVLRLRPPVALLPFPIIICLSIFWEDSNHHFRHTGWVSDLEKRMFVGKTLFTVLTVIKVLANGALVTDALDWGHFTAIT